MDFGFWDIESWLYVNIQTYIFSVPGPDSIGDHRVSVAPENRYVGIGTMSKEGTSETDYIWRPAPGTPFPRPKTAKVGEIGWQIPESQDWSRAQTARQIMVCSS